MNAPVHVQQIFTQFMPRYVQHHRLSTQQRKVSRAIGACRTASMGGQHIRCDHCGFEQQRYHSCRNRHCPQCQQRATEHWCEQQLRRVLPVNYFHLVFTLPHELNAWVSCHPQVIYAMLFHVVWQTLKTLGADPKRLNGQLGMSAVLHTWGQNLSQHVHLHCLVPGGALSQDHQQWHRARSTYLFPVKVLSRLYRGKMISALRAAHRTGALPRIDANILSATLDTLMKKDWVVYSKATLHHATTVVKYLSRYTHKIALSEQRLLNISDEHVTFRWQDYRDAQNKTMRLSGEEFIRRFLLHVLPKGFMRIRHFGYLANGVRTQKYQQIRQCIQARVENNDTQPSNKETTPQAHCHCPMCKVGRLQVCFDIAPKRLTGG